MALRGLNDALGCWQQQPEWRSLLVLETILRHWPQVVGSPVCDHSRPRRLRQNVLTVAVSHGTWAQSLQMQRLLILKKLNVHLKEPITDIRFSPAEWHDREPLKTNPAERTVLPPPRTAPPQPQPETPQEAFSRWQTRVKALAWERCPICLRPTPVAELELWDCCRFCHGDRLR